VLAAFKDLPAEGALAAWSEMAGDDAYDLLKAHPWRIGDGDKACTPASVELHTRLFRWLADANRALGDAGRQAALALVESVPADAGGTAPMFVALLALSRHDPAAPELDTRIARLEERLGGQIVVPPIVRELLDGLPKERAASVRAKLHNSQYSP
jgi:hypothetical protein